MTGRHHDKVVGSVAEAVAPLRDGMTIMVGGFGLSGNPEALIKAVVDRGVRDLTLVSNNAGNLGKGLAQWLRATPYDRVVLVAPEATFAVKARGLVDGIVRAVLEAEQSDLRIQALTARAAR